MQNNLELVAIVGKARKLTEAEQKFFDEWRGGLVAVVNSVDEAIALLNRL